MSGQPGVDLLWIALALVSMKILTFNGLGMLLILLVWWI